MSNTVRHRKELVVVSGKGGTGKTSVLASFAALAERAVMADCDVDAADLHLVLGSEIERRHEFRSGRQAVIFAERCTGCGLCREHCRFDAVRQNGNETGDAGFTIDPIACEGCGVCVRLCPARAIEFPERSCGEWYVSRTRFGPMVHARLGIAAENSGKLVTLVRREAREIAAWDGRDLLLVDGPPGIGCPVIASVTGASAVLVVTEPTLSGEHDLERLLTLTRQLEVPAAVCVNKWDVNPEIADRIERTAAARGAAVMGRVRYDPRVTAAQVEAKTVVEVGGTSATDMRKLWDDVLALLGGQNGSGSDKEHRAP
jgi:MinD superfamily P-loop ATPase